MGYSFRFEIIGLTLIASLLHLATILPAILQYGQNMEIVEIKEHAYLKELLMVIELCMQLFKFLITILLHCLISMSTLALQLVIGNLSLDYKIDSN